MRNCNNLVREIWCEIVTFWCEIVTFANFSANKKKSRGKGQNWKLIEQFDSEEDFQNSEIRKKIMSEFKFKNKKVGLHSITRVHQCKMARRKNMNCPAQIRVKVIHKTIYVESNEKVCDHSTTNDERKTVLYTFKADEKIKELLLLDVKTRHIKKTLVDSGLIDKNISQASFNGKIHRVKQKLKTTQTTTTVNALKEMIEKLKQAENDDEIRIMDNEFNQITNKIYYILSSPNMLKKTEAEGSHWMFSIDATYKLNQEGNNFFALNSI